MSKILIFGCRKSGAALYGYLNGLSGSQVSVCDDNFDSLVDKEFFEEKTHKSIMIATKKQIDPNKSQ